MAPSKLIADRPQRRWAAVLGLAALGFLVGVLIAEAPRPWSGVGRKSTKFSSNLLGGPPAPETLDLPSPDLAPEQVVEAQMNALTRCRRDRSAIHQVRAFASLANRSATGTIKQFEAMILTPPYDTMVVNRSWHAGRAAQHGDLATVLVTVVGNNNEVGLFRFYLSRRPEEADGSWVTDHVYCLTSGGPVDDAPEPTRI